MSEMKTLTVNGETYVVTDQQAAEKNTDQDAAFKDLCIGYDGTAYDSAGEAVRGQVLDIRLDLNSFYDMFEISNDHNILNPANMQKGYYTGTAGELVTTNSSGGHHRTVLPILAESGQTLYVRTNIPAGEGRIIVLMYLAEDETFLSQEIINSNGVNTAGTISSVCPIGTKSVHIWVDGGWVGYSFENWCVTFEEVDEFKPYSKVTKLSNLKEDALPPGVFEDNRPLAGKTIVNFGDSIFGKRRPPNDISTELARLTGATVYNCGFGGCAMAQHYRTNFDAFSMYRLADAIASGDWSLQDAGIADTTQDEAVPDYFNTGLTILKGLDFSNVDIITIAYGTNDFAFEFQLENAENDKDTTTYAGALRYSIETLLNAYPHLKIFICSQIYRFWVNSSNEFTYDSDSRENALGAKLTDFVAKTEEVAQAYHLPYINNYDIGMNKYNRSQYFSTTDGTHPLTTGCHLIAAHMAKELF